MIQKVSRIFAKIIFTAPWKTINGKVSAEPICCEKRNRLVKLLQSFTVQHQVEDTAAKSKQASLSNPSFGIINQKAESTFGWIG